jgi:hypothetical protein
MVFSVKRLKLLSISGASPVAATLATQNRHTDMPDKFNPRISFTLVKFHFAAVLTMPSRDVGYNGMTSSIGVGDIPHGMRYQLFPAIQVFAFHLISP